MNLSGLLTLVREVPGYTALLAELNRGAAREIKLPLLRAARAYLLAALQREFAAPLVVLTGSDERARALVQQIQALAMYPTDVLLFPPPDALSYERVPWQPETVSQRITVLERLTWLLPAHSTVEEEHALIVVAAARAVMTKTTPTAQFQARRQTLRLGQVIQMSALMATLYKSGYEHVSVVEGTGEFTHRGGIVDIFPADAFHPVRVEFFGDEIDSIRLFDPATQRSETRISAITVPPATEAVLPADIAPDLDLSSCHYPAAKEYQRDLEQLHDGAAFRGAEFYLPYLDEEANTLLDYLPPDAWVVVDDWDDLAAQAMNLEEQAARLKADLVKNGDLPADFARPFFGWAELKPKLQARSRLVWGHGEWKKLGGKWHLELADEPDSILSSPVAELGYAFEPGDHYGGQIKEVLRAADAQRLSGERVVLISRQAERLADFLGERGLLAAPVREIVHPPPPRSLTLVQGVLDEGWRLDAGIKPAPTPLSVITDAEIFGWRMPSPRRAAHRRATAPEAFFADVSPGDYVVHLEHGIGIFRGLLKMTLDGIEREYLLVEYAANDKLYVPIHQADRLGRYEGMGETAPQLHRLGTMNWARIKARTRKAVADIADELLELYAAREATLGHAFEPDTDWQSALEAAFPYLETPDQVVAIEAVKTDMEQPKPMDRLVCGDVGYGKTEVALRAAFKAVLDGKQVAVLTPTTVLAQQHYYTFKERLAPYPVNVEMLSRFRTPKQQRVVIAGLKRGTVDIVIGTHRLLQKDVEFKDLGLLVIDEEQRFGVRHKEKLKKMRTEVDVITLTATPIPRTLHMSLVGARDMSLINTPPEERLPIKTYLVEYDDMLIRRAILRELDRGGQVFFVHNRVQTINMVRRNLERLVPEASFVTGHGQMRERELEKVMYEFARGKYDVLVCTSIIESGLDMPNVNTIIIDRADRFGLADLYQLRGRVGRGAVRAYAYLLYKKGGAMTPQARKRLRAIMEASELGAGFQLAMRDLEIRGAGEILGARQHGHVAAVGFSLYTQLLAEAVERRKKEREKGREGEREREEDLPVGVVAIDLPLPTYLPADYVVDEQLRLKLYRRLASLGSLGAVAEMEQELADRFGTLPEPVRNMLYTLRLKALAQHAGIEAITREAGMIILRLTREKQKRRHEWEDGLPSGARVLGNRVNLDLGADWQEELARVLEVLGQIG